MRIYKMLMYILGVVAGAASTAQASVNGKIREVIRSLYLTAILSFILAAVILAVTILATEHGLYIPLRAIAEEPLWIWLGGACGTAIITLNVVCLPYLGSAKNVMIICFGQTITGLVIDCLGMYGSPQLPMTLMRMSGAVLVMLGIVLVSGIRSAGAGRTGAVSGSAPVYVILAFVNGFACASQIAINGALGECAGSAVKATLISMCVGFITTVILIVIITISRGNRAIFDPGKTPGNFVFRWWMVFGGVLSVVVVLGNAIVAPVLGTGAAAIMNLVGMMGAGLIIDATGFLGIAKQPVTISKVIGMLLMIAGTALISL